MTDDLLPKSKSPWWWRATWRYWHVALVRRTVCRVERVFGR